MKTAKAILFVAFVPLLFISEAVLALSFERHINYKDAVNEADIVIIGTVGEIKSYKTREDMSASKVSLEEVSLLSNGVVLPLNEGYELYVYGGVFPSENPKSRKKFTLEYIEGAPAFNSGDELLILIKENGRNILPLVGTAHSVLTIDRTSNSIVDESGSFLTTIKNDESLVFGKPGVLNVGDVELVYSIPDEPANEFDKGDDARPDESLDVNAFVELVAKWRLSDIEVDLQSMRPVETSLFSE